MQQQQISSDSKTFYVKWVLFPVVIAAAGLMLYLSWTRTMPTPESGGFTSRWVTLFAFLWIAAYSIISMLRLVTLKWNGTQFTAITLGRGFAFTPADIQKIEWSFREEPLSPIRLRLNKKTPLGKRLMFVPTYEFVVYLNKNPEAEELRKKWR